MTAAPERVLVVDDEPDVLDLVSMVLSRSGFIVSTARDGVEGLTRLGEGTFAVILSDIRMPGMDGIAMLRAIRERDLDVPVVLLTGTPDVRTAINAVELGVLRYLTKPIEPAVLQECITHAARLGRLARLKREALEYLGGSAWMGDRAGLEARFASALERIWMAYQPIVRWSNRSVFAYEALVRSDEPSMRSPHELLDAAEKLGRLEDLGRAIRREVGRSLDALPDRCQLFVNLHTLDLLDESLFVRDTPLARCASRIVLELTERASIERVADLAARVATLREMGFRMALDDLGAGYAGLTAFAALAPEIVKLDMSLVREIHREPTKLRLVRSMSSLCSEMGIQVVAEGIETVEERDAVAGAGCDLLQGYLFARPGRSFPPARFDGGPDLLVPERPRGPIR